MPRDLPLSNGRLLVTFDLEHRLRDIFYPYIGAHNHAAGCASVVGVWVDGDFAWLDSPDWQREMVYAEASLVTQVQATNARLGLSLLFQEAVDYAEDIFLRRVEVTNLRSQEREVRLFFHYEFRLAEFGLGDTIYYHPQLRALITYKGRAYFLLNGQVGSEVGIHDWSTGRKSLDRSGEMAQDAEDGHLERHPLAWGQVEGTLALQGGVVPSQGQAIFYQWIAAGNRFHDVVHKDELVRHHGPDHFLERTTNYWRLWVHKEPKDLSPLPPALAELYQQSLLIMRSQIDRGGAIIAANDSDITLYWRDTYSYMWPRDGSFVAHALDMAGYGEVTQDFYRFCASVITSEGYFLHKYMADGSLASSWMAWADEAGQPQLPIQEDETGLVLWSLWEHYLRFRDTEFISTVYEPLIKAAADFMVSYREPHTGLPASSYNLWEERRGIFSFTVAAVWAGLGAAHRFAVMFGDHQAAHRYHQAAQEIKEATEACLYDATLGRFLNSISVGPDGSLEKDEPVDVSLAGLVLLGLFEATDPRVTATMAAVEEKLRCPPPMGGFARYWGDQYHRVISDTSVAGNPWFIATLWMAEFYIARAQTREELAPALALLGWVAKRARPSGVLAEQINPVTGEPLNVSPLTWSHGALVTAILHYLARYQELEMPTPSAR